MPQLEEATIAFRRRLLGYDRDAVEAALASMQDRLHRAETRRDELIAGTANVERIGAQVADVLRSLADRAVELEVEAAATAAQVVEAAHVEAGRIRAEAAAVLAAAEGTAQQMAESSRKQQAAIGERRGTALVSLQIAIDQMGRLATTIEEIDLRDPEVAAPVPELGDDDPPAGSVEHDSQAPATEAVILLPWSASAVPLRPADPSEEPAEDLIAPALARLDGWANSTR